MKENKMDDQSLNGEILRKIFPNSDFLPEEYDPAIVGVDEVTQTANKAAIDVLIEKPDAELKEFVQTQMDKDITHFEDVQAQLEIEEIICKLEDQVLDSNIRINELGQVYEVKCKLRSRFPNSYFLHEVFDDAIAGVDVITGSIIYEWMHIGHLRILFSADPSWGDLGDRIWGAVDMTQYLEELTDKELQGKVKPTIIIQVGDFYNYWDDRFKFS